MGLTMDEKRQLIQDDNSDLTVKQKCDLLEVSRSTIYYKPKPINDEKERLMKLLDKHYTDYPFEGKIKRGRWLSEQVGYNVGVKRVRSLMNEMGIATIYPKQNTSAPNKEHAVYPYLLRDYETIKPNQVWSSDITYIPLQGGHVYLVAIIDWYSRYVIEWGLSITLEADFWYPSYFSMMLMLRSL